MKRLARKGIYAVFVLYACSGTKPLSTVETEQVNLDTFIVHAQPQPVIYKGSEKRAHDLLHTRLDLSFDWDSAFVYGQALLDLKPYFLPVDEVVLDARGFRIHEVKAGPADSLTEVPYQYDGSLLTIYLSRTWQRQDTFRVAIRYTAMPDRLKTTTGMAITSDKGLYFVKPDTADRSSWQIWSQGETEANSAWFPTIDAPNERMTQEILLTVDTLYETLSNGLLLFETDNGDGTKTAFWKMDQGHAPYLAMITIGDFAVVRDKWRNMEVNYYLNKTYKEYARAIFGNTPEMLTYFSELLGVDYPWSKFSQVVVKEYVSGAMENTTAVVHGDFIEQTSREMLDRDYEDYIAHELFHQWFGDLVTCESWAQLPLNESFATYGEYLWIDHKYGSDAAGYHLYQDLKNYFTEAVNYPKKMIRFDYTDADDMFDRHSYQKGGLILHMLRNYLGDEIFFTSLTRYLQKHAYSAVEIHDLRQVFEEVSGEDLTWFFDQWFFAAGHPELEISWQYEDSLKRVKLTVLQKQDFRHTPLFRLPVAIDVYAGGNRQTHHRVINQAEENFYFEVAARPDLVNFDADKALVAEKRDIKTAAEWSYLYHYGPLFRDRYEALEELGGQGDSIAVSVTIDALDDPFWKIREKALFNIDKVMESHKGPVREKLIRLSQNDPKSLVRAAAIDVLSRHYEDENLVGLYVGGITDSSYEVMSSALVALVSKDEKKGMKAARELEDVTNQQIIRTIADLYGRKGQAREHAYFLKVKDKVSSFNRFSFILSYAEYLSRQNDSIASAGVEVLGEIGQKEEAWWIRIAAVNAILDLQEKFANRRSATQQKLAAFENDNPNKPIYEKMLTSTDQVLAQIDKILEQLRENEENEKIKKILGE